MSWALSDVIEIHGDVGLSGGVGRSTIIYPDLDPTGRGNLNPDNNGSAANGRAASNPWKRFLSAFGYDNRTSAQTSPVESGPRPEPSATRSSQSNTSNRTRQPLGTPQPIPSNTPAAYYAPTSYAPTQPNLGATSPPLTPAHYQEMPYPHQQQARQYYPPTAQQPRPPAYGTGTNQYNYQPPPTYGNPAPTANPYPPAQYIPAGYPAP